MSDKLLKEGKLEYRKTRYLGVDGITVQIGYVNSGGVFTNDLELDMLTLKLLIEWFEEQRSKTGKYSRAISFLTEAYESKQVSTFGEGSTDAMEVYEEIPDFL